MEKYPTIQTVVGQHSKESRYEKDYNWEWIRV